MYHDAANTYELTTAEKSLIAYALRIASRGSVTQREEFEQIHGSLSGCLDDMMDAAIICGHPAIAAQLARALARLTA